MAKLDRKDPTNQEKVYNLYVELIQAEKDKKDIVKAHNENIKRIKEEIKAIVETVVDEVIEAQKE